MSAGRRPSLLRRVLVAFLRDEVRRTGLGKVVVGLSGGIDSSLAAALAAEALGPESVLGVRMPYRTSSPESLEHAQAVAEAFGFPTIDVDISASVDAYYDRFPDADARRRGNKMARERMAVLYDLSAAERALVLGTSNKTELLLGYGTLHGDMASAVNPLGDLYKTQVRALAREVGVPAEVIDKPPSADLVVGQTDESDLGFSYEDVDRLLGRWVDDRLSRDELVAEGFDAALVDRVAEMVRTSQFKRRLPVIAKVSRRTVDRDFRYPRDWGT